MGITELSLKKTERRKKKNSFYSEMANMKLIFLFSVVIAIGLSSGFELGKNQKEKSALKKLKSMHPMMLVKAKSAKQFKELKRQGAPSMGASWLPGFYPVIHNGDDTDDVMARSARDIPPLA